MKKAEGEKVQDMRGAKFYLSQGTSNTRRQDMDADSPRRLLLTWCVTVGKHPYSRARAPAINCEL